MDSFKIGCGTSTLPHNSFVVLQLVLCILASYPSVCLLLVFNVYDCFSATFVIDPIKFGTGFG